jgi:hypothetical protein
MKDIAGENPAKENEDFRNQENRRGGFHQDSDQAIGASGQWFGVSGNSDVTCGMSHSNALRFRSPQR